MSGDTVRWLDKHPIKCGHCSRINNSQNVHCTTCGRELKRKNRAMTMTNIESLIKSKKYII